MLFRSEAAVFLMGFTLWGKLELNQRDGFLDCPHGDRVCGTVDGKPVAMSTAKLPALNDLALLVVGGLRGGAGDILGGDTARGQRGGSAVGLPQRRFSAMVPENSTFFCSTMATWSRRTSMS